MTTKYEVLSKNLRTYIFGKCLLLQQDHQRVMVDPILLIVYIYDWFRLVQIALIGEECPDWFGLPWLVCIALIGLYCPDCPDWFRLP